MYQNHVDNDAHCKVFVRNRKVDAGVLYIRKKRSDLISTILKLISIYRNKTFKMVPKISLGGVRLT